MKIYLDYAAATPVDKRVLKVMQPYFQTDFYNPSAIYLSAQKVKKDIEAARALVAKWLGVKPTEVLFTAGGTEANNLALFGSSAFHPGSEIIATEIEHESILAPLKELQNRGYKIKLAKPDKNGTVSAEAIAKLISPKTVLVSVMYANNEIGTVQPIRQIATKLQIERDKRIKSGNKLPLYFHTDACQAGNYLPLKVHNLGVDLMTLNGGKIYGPKQSGVLYVAAHVKLQPQIVGGGQERGLRSGTENVPTLIGLSQALEIAQQQREKEAKRLSKLQKHFIEELQKLPRVTINGSLKNRLPNNVHFTFAGQDNERLMMQLDEAGIAVGLGSACSASSEEPSHVLAAIGLSEAAARSSLRFTMGRATTKKDIDYTLSILASLLR